MTEGHLPWGRHADIHGGRARPELLRRQAGGRVGDVIGLDLPALVRRGDHQAQLFEPRVTAVTATSRDFVFRYRSPAHWLEIFRSYYGPVLKTFAALAPPAQQALESDILALIGRFNRADDGTMVVPSEYLEIVIACR